MGGELLLDLSRWLQYHPDPSGQHGWKNPQTQWGKFNCHGADEAGED